MAKKMTEKEKAIQLSMEKLDITREEAEEVWAFDHDEIEVAEVIEIEAKIDANKDTEKRSSLEKVKYQKAKKKKDASKEKTIEGLFAAAKESGVAILPQVMTATKMSFMDENGNYYTMTITKHKACPDGYNGGNDKFVPEEEIVAEVSAVNMDLADENEEGYLAAVAKLMETL